MDIKIICRQYGTTMQAVADQLGCSRANVAKMMRGNPTLSTINKVADILNITPSQLVELLNQ